MKRYCGMCDKMVKGRECPLCGADTDAWPKAIHHTCHDMNPPLPGPCSACEQERSESASSVAAAPASEVVQRAQQLLESLPDVGPVPQILRDVIELASRAAPAWRANTGSEFRHVGNITLGCIA